MKERPLIVTTDLIPKILDGTKTKTRRLNGLKEINENPDAHKFLGINTLGEWCFEFFLGDGSSTIKYINCPYGQVGDRLWVRETICKECYGNDGIEDACYKVDEDSAVSLEIDCDSARWIPPMFMPRWASRITLEITGIRVERLQNISAKGLFAEGLPDEYENYELRDSIEWFAGLWNYLNAKRGYPWESNPWVWVIEFRKIKAAIPERM